MVGILHQARSHKCIGESNNMDTLTINGLKIV